MAESMIERVARAMCEAADEDWDAESYLDTASGNEPEDQRDYWRVIARAAIEAMREPTDAMVDAMDEYAGTIAPQYAYEAAIDAALNEQVSG